MIPPIDFERAIVRHERRSHTEREQGSNRPVFSLEIGRMPSSCFSH